MLKVFDGAIRVMLRRAASGPRLAKGACRRGSSIRSQWISSEQTTTSCFSASRRISRNSSSCQARPTGLCGWQSCHSFGRSRFSASATAAKSQPQRPSDSASGAVARRRPLYSGAERKGG